MVGICISSNPCNVTCANDSDCRCCEYNRGVDYHHYAYIEYSCVNDYTEELKQLIKRKQSFDKPDDVKAPLLTVPVLAINKRLSQLRQRHTR